ncbi:hypothetical protein [Henriciella aquimarina]|uniref:hypothetical protein n=1 Tax=Henriciella aquimarina TaxID=545261 RepID=UPI0009FFD90A|nr:hypothetical protein [Henriciella aquimarina]
MAYMHNRNTSVLAGVITGGIGAWLGFEQAAATGVNPFLGALIFGGAGFVIGMAGAFILKSLAQFLIFILLIAAIVYFARGPIEKMTGMDPVDSVLTVLENFGLPVNGDAPPTGG